MVIKASGVGVFDDALLEGHAHPCLARTRCASSGTWTRRQRWRKSRASRTTCLRRALPDLDLVLTYGGGDHVVSAYRALAHGTACRSTTPWTRARIIRCPRNARFAADLTFLGNRLPDREQRVDEFFLLAAARLPRHRFLLGGSGWDDKPYPANVTKLGHVPTSAHNALNVSARAVLNISRDSMASTGFSPATRVFEAAGAGACLLTDAWEGIELFLTPGKEVLVARDGIDVAEAVRFVDAGASQRDRPGGAACVFWRNTPTTGAPRLCTVC